MIQWDMIQEGDRLLLGLSGGKDSLSLLHVLLEFQKKLPIKFDIEVCTIDPMTPSFDPSPLIPYVEGLGLKYHYIRDDSESIFVIAEPNVCSCFLTDAS
jgi:tRNA(Ile)-lysidine synthase TilS/MesJ